MIIENIKITNNSRKKVTRICDECGKQEKTHLGIVYGGRKGRGNSKDYCKKCSYKYRKLEHPKMEKSTSWNGGRYLNENGYYRVYIGNLKYAYEHKVIMSKFLKRELMTEEKVHHIDCDKINNDITNLYLCPNKAFHWHVHQSLEDCVIKLLNKHVWFNENKHIYVLYYSAKIINTDIDISDLMLYNTFKSARRAGGKKYLNLTNNKDAKRLGSRLLHVIIAERMIGRELSKREVVHHINGNTLDNNLFNLSVMDRSEHKKCHYSLQSCGMELFKQGIIKFNKNKGCYYV